MHTDPDHEAALEALLIGERDEHDTEVQALFAANPALRARFERLRQLAADLDRVGVGDRAVLAEAAARPSPMDTDLHRLIESRLRPAHRFPVRLIAAAAVLVAALLTAWMLRQRPADESSTLGGSQQGERSQSPEGPVRDYELFSWSLPLPPECVYVLRFCDADADETELFQVRLHDTHWRPDADHRRQMTARMSWEVTVQDLNQKSRDGVGPVIVYLQH